jgi:hypothetical protein
MNQTYATITYPAPPAMRGTQDINSQVSGKNLQPTVKIVTARSEQAAADAVKVPAGGYVLVFALSKGRRYDRAAVAPLEEKRADGNPLPRVADAA